MADSGIYEILNRVNGKRYVGSAVDIAQRWREHRRGLKAGRHHSRHLQAAWNKHGETAFDFRVLMECEPVDLLREEQAEFDRRPPDYNICPTAGSTLGRLHSDETRRKIGASKAGLKMPPRDAEYRAKISAAHKGKAKSPEHLAALQSGRSRRIYTQEQRDKTGASLKVAYAEGRKDRSRPPEYREKIAATLRERAESPEFKERLRQQAADAWAERSEDDRNAHMEKVRAARGPITDMQRQAISDRQKGRPMHPNASAALLKANKGRKLTDTQRRKISENSLKSWTPERKAKQAAAMKAYHQTRRPQGS